jgi:hypothetical protein
MDDFIGIGALELALVTFPDGSHGVGVEITVGEQVIRVPMSADDALDVAKMLIAAARIAKQADIAGQN